MPLQPTRWADPQPRSSGSSDELANIHAYVTCDGAEKSRRDVSALVERNRRHAAIRMSILVMRTTLANLNESETGQDGGDLPRLENGNVAHRLGDLDRLGSDELPLKLGRAIFQQHGDDLFEVLAELVEGGALRVRTGPAGDVADEQPRGLVALDDCREALHVAMIPCEEPPNKPLQHSRRDPAWGLTIPLMGVHSGVCVSNCQVPRRDSTAEKQLAKIPGHIVRKFALWVDLVTVEGVAAARAYKHDY